MRLMLTESMAKFLISRFQANLPVMILMYEIPAETRARAVARASISHSHGAHRGALIPCEQIIGVRLFCCCDKIPDINMFKVDTSILTHCFCSFILLCAGPLFLSLYWGKASWQTGVVKHISLHGSQEVKGGLHQLASSPSWFYSLGSPNSGGSDTYFWKGSFPILILLQKDVSRYSQSSALKIFQTLLNQINQIIKIPYYKPSLFQLNAYLYHFQMYLIYNTHAAMNSHKCGPTQKSQDYLKHEIFCICLVRWLHGYWT